MIDLIGVSIISLFALLNKVAGAYGILAILTGAPSTTAQLTLYIYSMATIVIFLWGLKKIGEVWSSFITLRHYLNQKIETDFISYLLFFSFSSRLIIFLRRMERIHYYTLIYSQ